MEKNEDNVTYLRAELARLQLLTRGSSMVSYRTKTAFWKATFNKLPSYRGFIARMEQKPNGEYENNNEYRTKKKLCDLLESFHETCCLEFPDDAPFLDEITFNKTIPDDKVLTKGKLKKSTAATATAAPDPDPAPAPAPVKRPATVIELPPFTSTLSSELKNKKMKKFDLSEKKKEFFSTPPPPLETVINLSLVKKEKQ